MNRHIENAILSNIILEETLRSLNLYRRFIVILILMGYSQRQIADVLGCTHQRIGQIWRNFKDILRQRILADE